MRLTVWHLLRLSSPARAELIDTLSDEEAAALLTDWAFWVRPDQAVPQGDWRHWLVMAGRGFGKTRMGAEWIRALAEANGTLSIALVGGTLSEVRQVMVEGDSGLLAIAPPAERPVFEPSLRRLTWPSGAVAHLYSAAEPDHLRGPQHDIAWADEVGKWAGVAAWDNLMLSLRKGRNPRIVATTTPKPTGLLRRLIALPDTVVTRGRTMDNRANLPPSWIDAVQRTYGATRFARQELEGELIEDVENGIWSRDVLEAARVAVAPELRRVVIGVDPPVTATGDACGIVVVGQGADGKAYVLADHSVVGKTPQGWASAVAAAAQAWGADKVVAEANNGGDLVIETLRAADIAMPVKKVIASRGKVARAEPVAALYEAGRAFHFGAFPALEDEMCGMVTGGGYQGPGRSPDRADALVWAMSEVMLGKVGAQARVRVL